MKRIRGIAEDILAAMHVEHDELSIVLVSDRRIRTLNARYRKIDRSTDVLAFPSRRKVRKWRVLMPAALRRRPSAETYPESKRPPRLLGDVVISVATAQRQATLMGIPCTRKSSDSSFMESCTCWGMIMNWGRVKPVVWRDRNAGCFVSSGRPKRDGNLASSRGQLPRRARAWPGPGRIDQDPRGTPRKSSSPAAGRRPNHSGTFRGTGERLARRGSGNDVREFHNGRGSGDCPTGGGSGCGFGPSSPEERDCRNSFAKRLQQDQKRRRRARHL